MLPFRPRLRRAEHRHTVVTSGCWTLLLTGPERRTWGFWEPRPSDGKMRFVKQNKWFYANGHHPCE
jgi:hypothetical protein